MKRIFTSLLCCAAIVMASAQTLSYTYDNKPVGEGETIVLTSVDPSWAPDLYVHGEAYLNTTADCDITLTMTSLEGEYLEICLGRCYQAIQERVIQYSITAAEPTELQFHLMVPDAEEGKTYFGKSKVVTTCGESSAMMIVYITNDQNAGVERVTVENALQCNGRTIAWSGFAGSQTLRVFDMNGRMVYEAQVEGNGGSVSPALGAGNYIATLGSAKLKMHIK